MPSFSQLSEWLRWLEDAHPKKIDLDLTRIKQVAERLQVCHFSQPVISVAGTNGKGSVVATLAAIYCAANYRVGTYTSPHLLHYNERIKINNQPVSDAEIIAAFNAIDQARGDISLTYFEFSTLAALTIFQQANLNVIVLEVGLGGRLDAVNIIDAEVAIITAIDLDHQKWLGGDREAIGGEKAGILRQHQAAVIADPFPVDSIRQIAQTLGTSTYVMGEEYQVVEQSDRWAFISQQQSYTDLPLPELLLENCAAALMACVILQDALPVDEGVLREVFTCLELAGRFQKVPGEPMHIFDVAHNPHATNRLAIRLQELTLSGNLYAVWSTFADKDLFKTSAPLIPLVDQWFVAPLDSQRSATATGLADILQQQSVSQCTVCSDIKQAYLAAVAKAQANDVVLVFGSFYTVGEVMRCVW